MRLAASTTSKRNKLYTIVMVLQSSLWLTTVRVIFYYRSDQGYAYILYVFKVILGVSASPCYSYGLIRLTSNKSYGS